jgi:hypothetical protein
MSAKKNPFTIIKGNFMNQIPKLFLLFHLIIFSNLCSLTTNAQSLNKPLEVYLGSFAFPLEIGNIWNYRNGNLQPEMKLSIIDTIIIEGNKYYLKKHQYSSGYSEAYEYLRLRGDGFYASRVLDSNLTFFPNEDYLFYKKNATVGDVWSQKDFFDVLWYHIVLDTIQVSSFWGSFLPVKIVEITDSSLTRYWEYWSEEFGLVQQQNANIGSGGWSLLWGCYINGQQYGDTVLVSVVDEEQNYPADFKLFQNYPNPFNSSTNIAYEISKTSFVSIIVYDILGRELTQLVNELKPPGKYQVMFEVNKISKNLSTGVYFYKIFIDQKQQLRKMIYLK